MEKGRTAELGAAFFCGFIGRGNFCIYECGFFFDGNRVPEPAQSGTAQSDGIK